MFLSPKHDLTKYYFLQALLAEEGPEAQCREIFSETETLDSRTVSFDYTLLCSNPLTSR